MIIKSLEALKLLDTEQKIYDYVVSHLRQQNAQSVSIKGHCMYRNPAGLSCAVGCLIPESEYETGLEYVNIHGLIEDFPTKEFHKLMDKHANLLGRLQGLHDGNLPQYWEDRFKILCINFDLKYTPPVKAQL